jgi:hypothetical protein
VLGVPLALISTTELQVFFFFQCQRLIAPSRQAGFMTSSPKISVNFTSDCFVKLSFRNGGHQAFFAKLQATIVAAAWKVNTLALLDEFAL